VSVITRLSAGVGKPNNCGPATVKSIREVRSLREVA